MNFGFSNFFFFSLSSLFFQNMFGAKRNIKMPDLGRLLSLVSKTSWASVTSNMLVEAHFVNPQSELASYINKKLDNFLEILSNRQYMQRSSYFYDYDDMPLNAKNIILTSLVILFYSLFFLRVEIESGPKKMGLAQKLAINKKSSIFVQTP